MQAEMMCSQPLEELFSVYWTIYSLCKRSEVVTGDLEGAGRCPVIYRTALVCDPLFEPVETYMQRQVPLTSRFVFDRREPALVCLLVDSR